MEIKIGSSYAGGEKIISINIDSEIQMIIKGLRDILTPKEKK